MRETKSGLNQQKEQVVLSSPSQVIFHRFPSHPQVEAALIELGKEICEFIEAEFELKTLNKM